MMVRRFDSLRSLNDRRHSLRSRGDQLRSPGDREHSLLTDKS